MAYARLVQRSLRHVMWRTRRLLSDSVPDRVALARRFRRTFGRPLNLKNPRTFNEKLFWLMLYYRTPLVTRLADKYAVRDYVTERLGPGVLNELYGVWDQVDEIDFDRLPDAFVLKVTWASGTNILVRRKSDLDLDKARAQLAAGLKRSHYWYGREWCYKHITPRIICERFLADPVWAVPSDYKLFCFGGEPRFVTVDTGRFVQHRRDIFDLDWRRLPFARKHPPSEHAPARPSNLAEMIAFARVLSEGFPFVRVDFYAIEGKTVFGELTWYPGSGAGRFTPETYDQHWGDAIELPKQKVR